MPIRTLSSFREIFALGGILVVPLLGLTAETIETIAPAGPLPATCMVFTKTVSGTGWVVDRANRLIVTNYHVADKQTEVMVFFPIYKDGQVITTAAYTWKHAAVLFGKVRYADPRSDMALIELGDLPDHTPDVPFAGRGVRANDRVITAGNPAGKIWVIEREIADTPLAANFAYEDNGQRVTAPLLALKNAGGDLRGSSGSAVVNEQGELVGVVCGSWKSGNQQVRLCIELAAVKRFVDEARRQMEAQKLGGVPPAAPRKVDYRALATQALRRGEYEKAVELGGMAVQIRSRDPLSYHERAVAYSNLQKHDEAITDYSTALKLDATLSRTFRGRASAFFAKGSYTQALADCNEAIRLDPKYALAYLSRSKTYEKLGRTAEAQKDREKALLLDPSVK
jgi:Tfp pilus assembly protein PilF